MDVLVMSFGHFQAFSFIFHATEKNIFVVSNVVNFFK